MVRRCIVPHCCNTDNTSLSHRFPKNTAGSEKWQQSLQLTTHSIDELRAKYVVCSLHFDVSDYTNPTKNTLNSTAVPKINPENPRGRRTIETQPEISRPIPTLECEPSSQLTSSNDDILILSDDSILNYADHQPCDPLMQSIDSGDYDKINMLDIIPDDRDEPDLIAQQGTDSDVEILCYDNVIESEHDRHSDYSDEVNLLPTESTVSEISPSFEIEPKFDFACQVDNDVEVAYDEEEEFKQLTRVDLIELVKEQRTKINELEDKMTNFQKAHNQLLKSLDSFRTLVMD